MNFRSAASGILFFVFTFGTASVFAQIKSDFSSTNYETPAAANPPTDPAVANPSALNPAFPFRTADTAGRTFDRYGYATMRPCEAAETKPMTSPDRDTTKPGPNTGVVYCGHPFVTKYFYPTVPGDMQLRDAFRVAIKDDKLYDADTGKPYPDGNRWFVMDSYGNFFFFTKNDPHIHHSSFFDGLPIPSGGDLVIKFGRIVAISDLTGHYDGSMNYTILKNALEAFHEEGITYPIPTLRALQAAATHLPRQMLPKAAMPKRP